MNFIPENKNNKFIFVLFVHCVTSCYLHITSVCYSISIRANTRRKKKCSCVSAE